MAGTPALPPVSARCWRGHSAFRSRSWRLWIAVAVIVLADGVVSGWNIGRASYNAYYVDAARSMSLNWHAFAFGAFDPGGTVTLDKLSGFLVPQVLSIRLFGFHPWSTMLPQVVEGMLTALAAYVTAARWKGASAGLLAAAAVATTPLLTSMFGRSSEDAMVTAALAFAFWCWQSAILSGRLLPLLGSCLWVAVGFQAKMLQAWFIVPALTVGYVMSAPNPVWQRIRRGLLAGVVTVVLSLAWITAIEMVPASQRPFIDGTTNNNAYTMVFGFNGVNRVIPNQLPGVIGDTVNVSHAGQVGPARGTVPGTAGSRSAGGMVEVFQPGAASGSPAVPDVHRATAAPVRPATTPLGKHGRQLAVTGPGKLMLPTYTTQVGWLYPLAIAGALLGLWAPTPSSGRRRSRWGSVRPRRTTTRSTTRLNEPARRQREAVADLVAVAARPSSGPVVGDASPTLSPSIDSQMWCWRLNPSAGTAAVLLCWLLIDAAFLSSTPIPHTSYFAAISVQLAVLAAAGVVRAFEMRQQPGWGARSVLPMLLAAQTAWTAVVLTTSRVAPTALLPIVVIVGGAAAVAALPGVAHRPGFRKAVTVGAAVAVLLAPAVWSVFTISTINAGYADAYGGPLQAGKYGGQPALSATGQPMAVQTPFTTNPDPHLSPAQQVLVNYLRRRVTSGVLMAVDSWRIAEPYILDQGLTVLPMGGFTGLAPTPTLSQLQTLISGGTLKFVLLHDLIPRRGFGGAPLTGSRNVVGMYDGAHVVALRQWIYQHCPVVPPADYEGAQLHLTAETLYRCGPASPTGTATEVATRLKLLRGRWKRELAAVPGLPRRSADYQIHGRRPVGGDRPVARQSNTP